MFVEIDGPTALRSEMIRALAFSLGETQLETSKGIERCKAAVAAVWNGQEGFVAVLLRSLDHPAVRRFTFQEPIRSLDDVDQRLREGLEFAVSLGFEMDASEYLALGEEEQKKRTRRWNKLRKPRSGEKRARPNEPAAPEESTRQLAVAAAPEPESESGPAVLGRIALVRHGDDRPGLLAQLLSFF